ncbi:membrane lipoprotein lipid attachment site-containing protein [Bacillus sp. FJAT-22090]|uniref:membrane lipoprotein lipid attachment site-containing protein n=1 Tax=Bacillus sp. FJAT-22090 TaxID=1581038 RepID=UPI00119FEA31|nr:membrane lipoprotein lipid attachment site-containing protein [Bacillus sp. FJAT-22090]
MKKLILLFSILVLLTACNNTYEGISLRDIIDTFEDNGIKLEKAKKSDDETFGMKLNGVKPSTYSLNKEDFFIYIFKDIEDREKGGEYFYNSTASKNTLNFDKIERENILIFHVYDTKSDIDLNKIFDNF